MTSPNGARALVGRFDSGRLARPLELRVAISSVDEAGALGNLDGEPGGFDVVRARTVAAWRETLGVLEIIAPAPMRTNVVTALYHALPAHRSRATRTGAIAGRTTRRTARRAPPSAPPSRYGVRSAPNTRRSRRNVFDANGDWVRGRLSTGAFRTSFDPARIEEDSGDSTESNV